MFTLKRIMVALDLTEMDDTLIRYAAFLSIRPTVEKIFFIHTENSQEVPDESQKDLRRNEVQTAEAVRAMITAKVSPYFEELPRVELEVQVVEGNPVKEMLKLSKREQINLMLVGRKLHLHGSGLLPQRLLRTGRISVLFVPEHNIPKLNKAMVGIDFSEYSMMVLDSMLHSAIYSPDLAIECLHVYEVPPGYITLGVSYAAFEEKMRGYASDKFGQVLQKFPELQERAHLKLVKKEYNDDLGEMLVLEAKRANVDLLVIGAKGRSAMTMFVVGSVTAKVLLHNDSIPLLVFRDENEEQGFIDALLDI